MSVQPPRYALRFLRWFCREDFLDEIEGDLIELFEKQYNNSPRQARWNFFITVVRHFRPEYLKIFHKRNHRMSEFNLTMVLNYLSFALRNLRKRTAFSLINVVGLSTGICACLVLLRYIDFETSYDDFHQNRSSLYRINRVSIKNGERNIPNVWTTFGLGPALQTDIPEVLRSIRTHTEEAVVTGYPGKHESRAFHEKQILAVDSTFFKAFTFSAIEGNLTDALDDPNSIVLTKSAAQKYFGTTNPIGETMTLAGGRMNGSYTVTATMEDVPENSHFKFEFIIPLHNIFLNNQYKREDGWGTNNFVTYVQLYEESQFSSAMLKLPDFCAKWLDPKWKEHNLRYELTLQPLRKIHLTPGLRDYVDTISYDTIYFFGVIAIFILAIAWINYINLSTARSMERAKEVAIRKSIGAFRSELMTQFLSEAFVINFIAILLALLLAISFLPLLGSIIDKELAFNLKDPRLWLTLGVLFFGGTIASGLYPAIVMSSFRVSGALKGKSSKEGGNYFLRRALVVFQFAASLILISGTFLVYRQITFMQTRDKGLQMDQMLIVEGPGTIKWNVAKQKLNILKEEVKKIPGIKGVSTSGSVPGRGHNWGADVRRSGTSLSEIQSGSVVWIDPDFIPLYNIPFLAGRNFNTEIRTDMEAVIINEASLKKFGLGSPEEALQQMLVMDNDTAEIIGVLKDYNWSSLKSEVIPFIFKADTIVPAAITFYLEGNAIPSAIDAVEKEYKKLIPDEPFVYDFLDETFNAQYKSDQQFGNIFGLFAGLAVAISCLGLSGLASFSTAQRMKEVGIRKVLGASVSSIVYLLSGQFLRLVVTASVLAIPLIWYGMHQWLDTFAFKISLGWDLFVIPMIMLLAMTLLTVSGQVIKGAITNPASVLKSE
ncbi:MAG TPA: ABC transporter permease [Chryseolinea sp.]|nr:ABC transporter permease [Chryseolinea sp.]